jgi:hypothetical protein
VNRKNYSVATEYQFACPRLYWLVTFFVWKSRYTGNSYKIIHIIASPKGNQSESGALRPDTLMTISGIDSAAFQDLADLVKGMGQDLASFSKGNISCKVVSSSPTSINGIPAEEIMKDCNHGGIVAKGKAYYLGTQDNSIVVLGFTSRSNGSLKGTCRSLKTLLKH